MQRLGRQGNTWEQSGQVLTAWPFYANREDSSRDDALCRLRFSVDSIRASFKADIIKTGDRLRANKLCADATEVCQNIHEKMRDIKSLIEEIMRRDHAERQATPPLM